MRKISDNLQIIHRFIIKDSNLDKYFYPRESKLAKNLITKYSLGFLLWVPLPDGKKIQSLLWLSCKEGLAYLNSFILEYKVNNSNLTHSHKNIVLEKNKVGDDIQFTKRPTTLKEFLNLYK